MNIIHKSKAIKSIKDNYGGLPRSIYVLFFARVINRIGGFVYAFLALYMKAKLGYTESQIADFIIINAVFSMISPFIGGALADKKGRKLIYVTASTIGSLMFLACGFVTESSPELVPVLLIIASVFFNFTNPIANAMVADIVPDEKDRKRAYALIYLGINVGVAVGPVIGGYLLANHVKWFFIGDALTTLLSIALVAFFIKETMLTHEEMKKSKGNEKLESGTTFMAFLKRPTLVLYTMFSFASAFVYAQHSFGMSLHLESFFGAVTGPQYYGMLMSFNAVVVLVFTIMVTESLSKLRTIHSISLGAALYAVGFGLLAFASDAVLIYFVSVFIWTIGEIIMITNSNVFVMSNTPVNHRGRFSALIGLLAGAGYILSPKVISRIIETADYKTVWVVVAAIASVGAIGFMFTGVVEKKMKKMRGESTLEAVS
ncbi:MULTISPECIES: MFS transporter [unclassified Fusibacter]|uniref:MFS transporter n=1 Tax=unclassified Fusibacter TaxID=2624464 RepID=UPI001011553B|nr:MULTISPECIES: MFS transporter [unclassified Fusibacter]MCK8060112.1 MFS transporter [Fusibacter sp. A2]NPE22254.1 MFS transporter [Fusibacter sp. A1]RXV61028.1 MFS transporter [Fusibacter sp. A1]